MSRHLRRPNFDFLIDRDRHHIRRNSRQKQVIKGYYLTELRNCSWSSCKLTCMESNTNNISAAGLHGLDQRQYRSGTSEEVDVHQE